MTYIEGITPTKKHKTVEQKRGKYSRYHELSLKARLQEQRMLIIAGVTLLVLFGGWIYMFKGGHLAKSTESDAAFINSITQELRETETIDFPTVSNDEEVYKEIQKDVFPQFTN